MRKIVLFFVFAITANLIHSQDSESSSEFGFEKNDFVISGGFSLEDQNRDGQNWFKSTLYRFGGHYFISNHFSVNGAILLEKFDSPSIDNDDLDWSLGTRYFFTPEERFSFYLALQVNWLSFESYDNNNNFVEQENKERQYVLSPGVTYFISKNFFVSASLGAIRYRTIDIESIFLQPSNQEVTFFETELDLSNIVFSLNYKF